jgi:hypothetical protein
MDLVRKMLLAMEDKGRIPASADGLVIEDYDHRAIAYHMELLTDTNMVLAVYNNNASGIKHYRLTWQGYDFVEMIRDPERWKKVIDASAKAGGMSFEVIYKTALELVTKAVFAYVGLS